MLADIWSCPSFNELRRDGIAVERWNLLHPAQTPRKSYVEQCLAARQGPVIAATDYMRAFAEQIRPYVPRRYVCLGTDGFGRSDYRVALRKFFEVNRHYVAVAALKSLADEGVMPNQLKRRSRNTASIRIGHHPGSVTTGWRGLGCRDTSNFHRGAMPMGEVRQVRVPDIGDFKDVPIIEIRCKPGDRVAAEAPLITLESDKASMEVPRRSRRCEVPRRQDRRQG